MGVYNLTQVNTEPGNEATCPFSPPAGWLGSAQDYVKLMRQRYTDQAFSQLMGAAARMSKSLGEEHEYKTTPSQSNGRRRSHKKS
ncbi:hypothetical protein VTH8203_04604 [Vibrio thalassae]|uniref:Uncharacterized protein n=1 Tax=Vibrio thalassae TaxID=1243014 RepID=A0A240EQP2_9VIBR|nr:hypothetical protein VTH8203_04604 [Vibrio thalassae]